MRKIILNFVFLNFVFLTSVKSQCPFIDPVLKTGDIPAFKNLIEKLKNCESRKDSFALVYHKLGAKYFYENPDSAILFTKKALDLRLSIIEKPNSDIARSAQNLAALYRDTKQFRKAMSSANMAISHLEKIDKERQLYSYLTLGDVNYEMGEYNKAEDGYKLVIEQAKLINSETRLAQALLNLGNLQNEKGSYAKAIQNLEQALPLLFKLNQYENEASCLKNLGKAYYFLKKYPRSLKYYGDALELYQALKATNNIASTYSNLSLSYQKSGKFTAAFDYAQKGLSIAKSIGDPTVIAQNYDNLGEYYFEINDFKKAATEYQNAIKVLMPAFQTDDVFENPDREILVNVSNKIDLLVYLSDKARALRELSKEENNKKYLTNALDVLKLGDILIDQLRQEHSDEGTKLFWREKVIYFYENAIEICHELQDGENAFFFFEKSKAILLLEAIQSSDALASIPDSIRNVSYKIKKELIGAREDLEDANKKERPDKLQDLMKVQKSFDDFNLQLSKEYSQFASVKFESDVIKLSDFRTLLSKSLLPVTSIHYFYGEKNIYALVTDQDQAQVHNLGDTKIIESEIRKYLAFFKNSSEIENAPNDYISQAYKIYSLLVKPLNLSSSQDLLLFPDGALAYLPFEALTYASDGNISSAAYLIKGHSFRYAYSATILANQEKSETSFSNNTIAAFAPFAKTSSNPAHPVLAFSEDELGQIQEQVAGEFWEDQNASKAKLLENKEQHTVLHLSTHAFSSPSEDKPKIVFADTELYLSELYTLQIPSKLVVLSACQTNIGKLSPGEGVMSLGRGFTYAGAKSLISSLWNVNANSTGAVLSDFYKNLQMKVPKHLALHLAKRSFLENENISSFNRSPYYWAGLIYYGDAAPLDLKQPGFSNLKIGVIALLLLGFLSCLYFTPKIIRKRT